MTLDDVINLIGNAVSAFQDMVEFNKQGFEIREKRRIENMDDYELMEHYEKAKKYEGDNYYVNISKERAKKELINRDYEVE